MVSAGHAYWLQDRVSALGIDAEMGLMSAKVRGGNGIEKVIATGQARWRKVDGPALCRGDDQAGQWHWVTLAGAEQRLALDGLAQGQILLATAPPIILDEATGLTWTPTTAAEPVSGRTDAIIDGDEVARPIGNRRSAD